MKPSTGAAVRDHRNAVRDRSESCPRSIGITVRLRRNPHSNTVESYFALFKHGMRGVYQHRSEKHLHRYLAEFDFRYNACAALGPGTPREVAMSKTITVRITGKGPGTDAPSIGDLLDQLRDYFDLLGILEETLAEDGQSAIVWRVVNATTASPIAFTIQAFARQYAVNVDARADHVVDRALSGLRLLEQKAERPPYFTEPALVRAERIFERVTNGLDNTEISTAGLPPVVLTPNVARLAGKNARSVLEPAGRPYKEVGSLEGYVQTVGRDGRGRRILQIKHRLTGDEVKCFVVGQAEKELAHREIEDVWRGGRISVFGTIHYRAPGRIAYMEADTLRFLRSKSELPDIDDIIDPDFTGGLRSEDYLEKLRNGDLS